MNIKISLYWKCQIFGWGIISLLWLYIALARDGFTLTNAFINYVLDVIVCVGLTHTYRIVDIKSGWNLLNLKRLIVKVFPSIVLLSIMFMILMNLKMAAYVYLVNDANIFKESLFVWNPVLITGLRHMSIWILAYHLYYSYRKEVNTAKTNAQLSIIAKQAQLDNLSAQLNPHFLFNSLNTIKALIVEDQKRARRAVDLLSDILRTSLYEKKNITVSVDEELSLVKDYVELEQLRFEERLNVKMDVDRNLKDVKIPLLSVQLLVENAIKHGIDKRIGGGEVSISVQQERDAVIIIVKNPGSFSKEKNKGLGLKNLKKRLQLNYNGAAKFKIESQLDKLTITTLIIPVDRK
ncbi:MAG: histidine kinase [Bacteroidota bacterium]